MNIKIACPYNVVTGGIELLHQVANELNTYDKVSAEIWYINDSNRESIPSEYAIYNNIVNNIVYPNDILLFPEIWADYTNRPEFNEHKKIIYWESVNNYFGHTPKVQWFKFKDDVIHISQSEYSNRFLAQLNVPFDNIIEITDYVNDDFLNCQGEPSWNRSPIVLYNPIKGWEFTEKLIRFMPDVDFQPVSGMTRQQILELMRKSMVWIDFGNFPGKDRLPREAAACGMCVVTGKRGSAKYQEDLNIPDGFKFDDVNFADLADISHKIRNIFKYFDDNERMFRRYREHLHEEKDLFKFGIQKLVEKLWQ